MNLPKELTTVTPLSKYLAIVVFVLFPILGFFLGMKYQELMNLSKRQEMEENLTITRAPTPTPFAIPTVDPSITANWKTYANSQFEFTLRYPAEWKIAEAKEKDYNIIQIYPTDKKINDIDSEGPSPFTSIRIVVKNNPKNLSYMDYALEEEKSIFVSGNFVSTLKHGPAVIVDGIVTGVITGQLPSWGRKGVYIPHKGKIYIVNASSSDRRDEINKMIDDMFDQILSTFKFTDQEDIIPPQVCTQDVKLCPDGKTYVGRKPPSCDFAICPQ